MKNLKFILFWISQILSFPLMAQTVSNVQAEQVGKKNVVTYSLDKQTDILTFTVNGVTFNMVKVAGGTFTMGATKEHEYFDADDARPAHQVTLTDYYIGQTEVTQALWEAVMGNNPSNFKGENLPVENAYWDDCQAFIEKLNRLLSKDLGGKHFALPTEAQWEFAARGGTESTGYKYAGSNNLDDVAWYRDNSVEQTHPVAQKQPNELGLYDMSGNVAELCQDWYGSYSSDAQTNPQGPARDPFRALRGGHWRSEAKDCRVSVCRHADDHLDFLQLHLGYIGLRLCLIP